MTEKTLLHVTDPASWKAGQLSGVLRPPSLETVGFVHLCDPSQLDGVLARFFQGQRDLVILHLEPDRLPAEALRFELVPDVPGERFAHLYAPLPVNAVRSVEVR
ncbi:MAG: DUF952 domain-containing protein [Sandaracinaceae bacterium]